MKIIIVNQNARSDARNATSTESATEIVESNPTAGAAKILLELVIKVVAKWTENDIIRNNQFSPFRKIVNLSPLWFPTLFSARMWAGKHKNFTPAAAKASNIEDKTIFARNERENARKKIKLRKNAWKVQLNVCREKKLAIRNRKSINLYKMMNTRNHTNPQKNPNARNFVLPERKYLWKVNYI